MTLLRTKFQRAALTISIILGVIYAVGLKAHWERENRHTFAQLESFYCTPTEGPECQNYRAGEGQQLAKASSDAIWMVTWRGVVAAIAAFIAINVARLTLGWIKRGA